MTKPTIVSNTASPSPSKKRLADRAADEEDGIHKSDAAGLLRSKGLDTRATDSSVAKIWVSDGEDEDFRVVEVCTERDHDDDSDDVIRDVHEASFKGATTANGEVRGNGVADDDGSREAMERSSRRRSRVLQEAVSQGVRQAQLQLQAAQQQQQKQSTPPASIRWERFLPQRQLRVLLVEDDDSTRHVVTALLRNCSYEVTSAASGLVAWGLLIKQCGEFDIVLTEVVMPGLSGIGLLSRIMGHETLKHIPVIMMSSHDSMGIVFKCLSKGAVDFLVKPVRKNELKNLWQHVWRRCHSSSGSGSDCGSGSQTRKVSSCDAVADCGNSNSNDDSENTSSDLNIRGGSDNGSGTQLQGLWTRRAIEVESSQHNKYELSMPNSGILPYASKQTKKSSSLQSDHYDSTAMASKLAASESNFCVKEEDGPTRGRAADTACEAVGQMEDEAGSTQDESSKAANFIGGISCKIKANGEEQQGESADVDELLEKHASNSPSSKDKVISDSSSPSTLELTLKHPWSTNDDRARDMPSSGLRQSYSSAFSRYNSGGYHIPKSPGIALRFKPVHGSQPCAQGSNCQLSFPVSGQMQRSETPLPYLPHGPDVNCKQDNSMQTTFAATKDSGVVKEELVKVTPLSPAKVNDGLKCQALLLGQVDASLWASVPERSEGDDICLSYDQSQTNQRPQVHHHTHHHSHHHHHHVQHHFHFHHKYASQQRSMATQQEDQTVTNLGSVAPVCGSSSMVHGLGANNAGSGSSNNNANMSLNGSASGSNNGSNGHSNEQSATALPAGDNRDNVIQTKNLGEGETNSLGLIQGMQQSCGDQNRFARREAALTKFRQKRKERCFEKKVRYQSRKRLAEQRPRIRGQFVRQQQQSESTASLLDDDDDNNNNLLWNAQQCR